MKVLIAEDEAVSCRLLESLLTKWGYDVIVAHNGLEAWEILQHDGAPNLAVLDWMMPELDGVEVCKRLRTSKRTTYTYVVLLTAKRGKGDIISGLEAGADDYITKPFDHEELKWRLRIGQRILDLEGRLQRRLTQTASTDTVTGVLNRRAFLDRLTAEVNRAKRLNKPMGLFLLDLDGFTTLNDAHGYHAGDLVLQDVADCLNRLRNTYDFIGRYGGDEFIACCPECAGVMAETHARKIHNAVDGLKITLPNRLQELCITASLGVTTLSAGSTENVDTLIVKLEEALYQAKSQGGNRVNVIF